MDDVQLSAAAKRRRARAVAAAAAAANADKPFDVGAVRWLEVDVDTRVTAARRNYGLTHDALVAHGMQWGSLSVAWGAAELATSTSRVLVGEEGANLPYLQEYNDEQTLFYTTRTDGTFEEDDRTWTGQPAELIVARVAMPKRRTTKRTQMRYIEQHKSTRVQVFKRIIHPGEVNRVRVLPAFPHMCATHTDSPTVFVWNANAQTHRALPSDARPDSAAAAAAAAAAAGGEGGNPSGSGGGGGGGGGRKRPHASSANTRLKCSVPDLELVGHTAAPKYALDASGTGARFLSGSSAGTVLMWDVGDFVTGGAVPAGVALHPTRNIPQLSPRCEFSKKGHTQSVEDCSFNPS